MNPNLWYIRANGEIFDLSKAHSLGVRNAGEQQWEIVAEYQTEKGSDTVVLRTCTSPRETTDEYSKIVLALRPFNIPLPQHATDSDGGSVSQWLMQALAEVGISSPEND